MTCGRVKASARKMHVGRFGVQIVDAPLPEGERLGVRIVDAEDADAARDPELEDGAKFVPEALPVGRLEVERIDVLIFFRRILRVLDGAVGADDEPVGMLFDPGMVGGALEGDVEGDLHAVVAGGGDEMVEVREGAELGMDGFVAAFCRADGPGAAFVVGRGGDGVVGPLRKAVPMGWMGGM